MSVPRKHHVVAQVQLRAFAQDGRVRVHPSDAPRSTRVRPVREAGYVLDAYTVKTRGGLDMGIEKRVLGFVEQLFAPVIDKLESGKPLTQNDWGAIGVMIAAQAARDGQGRTFLDSTVRQLMGDEEQRLRAANPMIGADDLRRKLDRFGRSTIVKPHILPEPGNVSVAGLGVLISKIYQEVVLPLKGLLLRSTGRDFIISDSPVYTFEPVDLFGQARMPDDDVARETTEITMPLTRRHAVLLTRDSLLDEVDVGNDVVAIVNNRTVRSRFCTEAYAYPDPSTIDLVVGDFVHEWWRVPLIPILERLPRRLVS